MKKASRKPKFVDLFPEPKRASRLDAEDFLADIIAVYKKHRFSLGFDESDGGFLIKPLTLEAKNHLLGASIVTMCPCCRGPAYISRSAETMKSIMKDPAEKITACGVGPWGYVCSIAQSGGMISW